MKKTTVILTFFMLTFSAKSQITTSKTPINNELEKIKEENATLRKKLDELNIKYTEANLVLKQNNFTISKLNSQLRIQESDFAFYKKKTELKFRSYEDRFSDLKMNRFGLGLSLGTTLDKELNLKPYFGVGITFNLLVF